MKTQFLKSLLFLAAFAVISFTVMTSNANAQTGRALTLETNFDFHVGEKKLSAGKYKIKQISAKTFSLQSVDEKESVIINAPLTAGNVADGKTEKVIFHRYGDNYFLTEIWSSRDAEGRGLFKSKAEKAAENKNKIAEIKTAPERVEVVTTVK